MAVNYKKLFHLMIEKNLSNSDLQRKAGFSGNILTRLKRNRCVTVNYEVQFLELQYQKRSN